MKKDKNIYIYICNYRIYYIYYVYTKKPTPVCICKIRSTYASPNKLKRTKSIPPVKTSQRIVFLFDLYYATTALEKSRSFFPRFNTLKNESQTDEICSQHTAAL